MKNLLNEEVVYKKKGTTVFFESIANSIVCLFAVYFIIYLIGSQNEIQFLLELVKKGEFNMFSILWLLPIFIVINLLINFSIFLIEVSKKDNKNRTNN